MLKKNIFNKTLGGVSINDFKSKEGVILGNLEVIDNTKTENLEVSNNAIINNLEVNGLLADEIVCNTLLAKLWMQSGENSLRIEPNVITPGQTVIFKNNLNLDNNDLTSIKELGGTTLNFTTGNITNTNTSNLSVTSTSNFNNTNIDDVNTLQVLTLTSNTGNISFNNRNLLNIQSLRTDSIFNGGSGNVNFNNSNLNGINNILNNGTIQNNGIINTFTLNTPIITSNTDDISFSFRNLNNISNISSININQLTETVNMLQNQLSLLQQQIETIPVVPIGGIIPYYGQLTVTDEIDILHVKIGNTVWLYCDGTNIDDTTQFTELRNLIFQVQQNLNWGIHGGDPIVVHLPNMKQSYARGFDIDDFNPLNQIGNLYLNNLNFPWSHRLRRIDPEPQYTNVTQIATEHFYLHGEFINTSPGDGSGFVYTPNFQAVSGEPRHNRFFYVIRAK